MNISMQLTFDGLVRALRWKALSVGEAIAVQQASGSRDTGILKAKNAGGASMRNGAAALQKALFEALKKDDELIESIGGERIYDHVPPKTPFPM